MSDTSVDDVPTVESLLEITAKAWERFRALIDSVPADRIEEPGVCGDWSVKTVVGHVAFWDGYEAERLGRDDDGESADYQPLNEQNARESAQKSFEELRSQLETNHARVIAAVSGKASLSPGYIRELLDDHYIDHGREIEAWLAKS